MVMGGSLLDITLDAVEWGVKTLKRRPPCQPLQYVDPWPEPEPEPEPPIVPDPPTQEPPEELVQWGLKLPNQNIVWDNALYCGLPLGTGEQRGALMEALRKTALDMGFDVRQFLAGFGWIRRVGVPGVVWSDATLTPLIGEDLVETAHHNPNDAGSNASEYQEQN